MCAPLVTTIPTSEDHHDAYIKAEVQENLGNAKDEDCRTKSRHQQSEPDKTKILAKSTIGNIKLDVVSATVDNSGNAKVEIVFTNRDRYDASAFIYCNRGCITYDNLGQEYGCSRVEH